MNTSSKVVVSVLSGLAVGSILGILFAPNKGTKTRKRILKKGVEFKDEIKSKFEDLYNEIADKYELVIEETKEYMEDHKA